MDEAQSMSIQHIDNISQGWNEVYIHIQTFKENKVYIVKRLGSEIRQSGFKSQLCYVFTG